MDWALKRTGSVQRRRLVCLTLVMASSSTSTSALGGENQASLPRITTQRVGTSLAADRDSHAAIDEVRLRVEEPGRFAYRLIPTKKHCMSAAAELMPFNERISSKWVRIPGLVAQTISLPGASRWYALELRHADGRRAGAQMRCLDRTRAAGVSLLSAQLLPRKMSGRIEARVYEVRVASRLGPRSRFRVQLVLSDGETWDLGHTDQLGRLKFVAGDLRGKVRLGSDGPSYKIPEFAPTKRERVINVRAGPEDDSMVRVALGRDAKAARILFVHEADAQGIYVVDVHGSSLVRRPHPGRGFVVALTSSALESVVLGTSSTAKGGATVFAHGPGRKGQGKLRRLLLLVPSEVKGQPRLEYQGRDSSAVAIKPPELFDLEQGRALLYTVSGAREKGFELLINSSPVGKLELRRVSDSKLNVYVLNPPS